LSKCRVGKKSFQQVFMRFPSFFIVYSCGPALEGSCSLSGGQAPGTRGVSPTCSSSAKTSRRSPPPPTCCWPPPPPTTRSTPPPMASTAAGGRPAATSCTCCLWTIITQQRAGRHITASWRPAAAPSPCTISTTAGLRRRRRAEDAVHRLPLSLRQTLSQGCRCPAPTPAPSWTSSRSSMPAMRRCRANEQ
jgi:hypothetical protein